MLEFLGVFFDWFDPILLNDVRIRYNYSPFHFKKVKYLNLKFKKFLQNHTNHIKKFKSDSHYLSQGDYVLSLRYKLLQKVGMIPLRAK